MQFGAPIARAIGHRVRQEFSMGGCAGIQTTSVIGFTPCFNAQIAAWVRLLA